MFGHFAENIGIPSPDGRHNVAFNMYALDCEIMDAMNEVRALINDSGYSFETVLDLQQFAEDMIPSISGLLAFTDYRKLFYEHCEWNNYMDN